MSSESDLSVTLEYRGRVAIITLDNQKQLNALSGPDIRTIATWLREIAARDEVVVTVLAAKGKFFSAGARITKGSMSSAPDEVSVFNSAVIDLMRMSKAAEAFYSHPKILVTALNGPVVGIAAAFIGHADFIYAAPHTFLLTPFTSLGLTAEGGASLGFVRRMGMSKANEALLMSKRLSCEELVHCGFVNKVFDVKPGEDSKFLDLVLKEVDDRLGDHLVTESLLKVKSAIRRPDILMMDGQIQVEVRDALDLRMKGISQEGFRKWASGEKKHKL